MVIAVALLGCDSGRATGGKDASGDQRAGDSTAGKDSQPPASVCPAKLPAPSAACSREGLVCQFGKDPRRSCRPSASCTGGKWQVSAPKCAPLPKDTCPATRAAAAGKQCKVKDAYCSYPGDLVCQCTNCIAYPVAHCSGPLKWKCDVPSADAQCPAGKPNLGAPCSVEGKKCTYHCGTDGARQCKGKVWTRASSHPCPVSSRRAKRDIVYLTDAQAAAISRELLQVRLATYLYKDPALGAGRHLGFILEDAGRTYAGDPARGQVDLYGYTSMLLATVQSQQKSIRQLRRELRALRAEVRTRKKRE